MNCIIRRNFLLDKKKRKENGTIATFVLFSFYEISLFFFFYLISLQTIILIIILRSIIMYFYFQVFIHSLLLSILLQFLFHSARTKRKIYIHVHTCNEISYLVF